MKGWDWELEEAKPDPTKTERCGKIPRYWISLIQYRRKSAVLDGPGVIQVDLQSETASWEAGSFVLKRSRVE